MLRVKNLKLFFLAISIFILMPYLAKAATLYMEPAEGTYGPGDIIPLDIKIDIDGACINTIEGEIAFPKDYLNIVDFLTGESILNIWVDLPDTESISLSNRSGVLHFSGGIPGGYCGKIPGDPGLSNIVGRIVFAVPSLIVSDVKRDRIEVGFSSASRALINDGLGTADRLITKGAVFAFSQTAQQKDQNWQNLIKSDTTPPEPFVVELQSNPGMFNGKYYIIFSTLDKQSGMDHFEVLEIRPEEEIGVKPQTDLFDRLLGDEKPAPAWEIARIPYLLEDQSLLSIIKVKAIDNAGNERIVEYLPPQSMQKAEISPVAGHLPFILKIGLIAGAVIIAIAIIVFILIKKSRRSRAEIQNEEENNRK